MRQTVGGRQPLVAVDRFLLPREVQVATVRRHPAVLIPSAAMALGGLLLAGALSATVLQHQKYLLIIVWLLWLILVGHLIWKTLNWAVDYFVVTDARLLLTSGLLTRNVAMMPLTKVTDMTFQRSFAGRLLGYGEFIVESAGQDQALSHVDHIPYPEQLYLLICGMIFPGSAEDDEDAGPDEDDGLGLDEFTGGSPDDARTRRNRPRRDDPRNDEL
ncbi:MAG TPA: PH domain-containing protein [Streptosporangiaceae bacterium]|nr:PH domain-containing protein [Streptosporangiaceae bacterium]